MSTQITDEMKTQLLELMRGHFDFKNTDIHVHGALMGEDIQDSPCGAMTPDTLFAVYCRKENYNLEKTEKGYYYFCLLWDDSRFFLKDLDCAKSRKEAKHAVVARFKEILDPD